jgi:nucleotide-binding universal stress UspA family protein
MTPVLEQNKSTLEPSVPVSAISVKNVLFATDFSPTSEAALSYAAAVCHHFGSTLHVVHVISDANILMMTGGVDYASVGTIYEDAHTDAKEKIADIAARCQSIPCRSHVRHGQVWKNVDEIIAAEAIDLIVVGTHGRGGLGKLLLGSVAEGILRHASCPVLTVGPHVSGHAKLSVLPKRGRDLAPPELALRDILVATNFDQNSLVVAPIAVQMAEAFESRLTLLHVIEDYSELGQRPGPIEAGLHRLRSLIPQDHHLQYKPETVLEFGPPAATILKVAEDREADLLVLGARRAQDVPGTTHLPWHTAYQVIAHATCPVLTIRA